MNTTIYPSTVSSSLEHVQIHSLTRIALLLSSLAAIPGFFGSLYLLIYAVGVIGDMFGEFGQVDYKALLMLSLFISMNVLGWWLYQSYWLELYGTNSSRLSWFVSALFNGALSLYTATILFRMEDIFPADWLGYGFVLLWTLTMTVISVWVWILKARH